MGEAVSSLALSLTDASLGDASQPHQHVPARKPGAFLLPSLPPTLHPVPGLVARLGRRGLAGRKRQAAHYLQSLVSGKGGREWERTGFLLCFLSHSHP